MEPDHPWPSGEAGKREAETMQWSPVGHSTHLAAVGSSQGLGLLGFLHSTNMYGSKASCVFKMGAGKELPPCSEACCGCGAQSHLLLRCHLSGKKEKRGDAR